MSNDEEMNPDSVSLEDVQSMSEGEFRQWSYLKINEICDKLGKVENRQWMILSGIVITILIALVRIFLGV